MKFSIKNFKFPADLVTLTEEILNRKFLFLWSGYFKFRKLKVIFWSSSNLHSLFRYEDNLEEKIHSDFGYRHRCRNCKVVHYGKTFFHFLTKASEHRLISNFTGKHLKAISVTDHVLEYNSSIATDHFDLLVSDLNKSDFLLRKVYSLNVTSLFK